MATKKTTSKKSSAKKTVTENDIRKKAQQIYDERVSKGTPGTAESDWVQAEKELGVK